MGFSLLMTEYETHSNEFNSKSRHDRNRTEASVTLRNQAQSSTVTPGEATKQGKVNKVILLVSVESLAVIAIRGTGFISPDKNAASSVLIS